MSNEQNEPPTEDPRSSSTGYWIAIGLALGAAIGAAMDNLAIGVAIGLALVVGIGAAQSQRNKNR